MAETSTQEKAKLCYERRAACIIKKSRELEILCGVKIGLVILNPDGKLESWPPELSDVKALLDACKERPVVKRQRQRQRQKRKDPENSHCCQEILNSKLEFPGNSASAEGNEIAAVGQDGADLQNNNGNAATFKGKEIATIENMDSGILQDTYLGAYHGSSSSSDWFDAFYQPAPLQSSFTALGSNCLPPTAVEEYCGELRVRKKARLQNSIAAPTDHWETVLTNSRLTDAMLSLLEDI